jgi:hypothetical protein
VTIAPQSPTVDAYTCDCAVVDLFGHCACDRCEDCGECSGQGCACECMRAERSEYDEMWIEKAAKRLVRETEFYLGTHMVGWLWDPRFFDLFDGITFFISYNRMIQYKELKPALHRVCFDSGGFTHLKQNGRWTIPADEYAANVRRWYYQVGPDKVVWIAPRDWMCEPWVIFGKNQHLKPSHRDYFHGTREARGIAPGVVEDPERDLDAAVLIHQQYTVEDYLQLKRLAPELPIIPVLQGWTLEQYQRCADMYAAAGVDLAAEPIVGLGSVCRRQATSEIREIAEHFASQGLRLHGFGVKTLGLAAYAHALDSADSMASSDTARKEEIQLFGCWSHKNCANCPYWFYRWRQGVVRKHLTPAPPLLHRPDIAALTEAVVAAHIVGDKDGLITARIAYEKARAAVPHLHQAFDAELDSQILAMVDGFIESVAVAAARADTDGLMAAQADFEAQRDRCPIKIRPALDSRLESRLAEYDQAA